MRAMEILSHLFCAPFRVNGAGRAALVHSVETLCTGSIASPACACAGYSKRNKRERDIQ